MESPKARCFSPPRKLTAALTLAAVSFCVYANALTGDFVWDDTTLFIEKASIWRWENLWLLLTTQDNLFVYNDTGFYRPLVNLTFLVDRWVWGNSPFGYHLTNILLHALATVTVFGIGVRITRSFWESMAAGLLFAVHPVHTEAVAWINGRNNVLAISLYLAAVYAYLRFAQNRRPVWLGYAALFLALSLFSKEYALTYPLLLLLYEGTYIGSAKDKRWVGKRLGMAVAVSLCVFTVYGMIRASVIPSGAGVGLQLETLPDRLLMFPKIAAGYVSLLILPAQLAPYHRIAAFQGWTSPDFMVPVIAAIMATAGWLWSFKRSKTAFLAMGWIGVTLLPVVGIVPIPYAASPVSERHLYLPSVGYCMLLACFLSRMKAGFQAYRPCAFGHWTATLLMLALVGTYSVEVVKRNRVWQNEVALWEDAVFKDPDDFRVRSNLAIAYASSEQFEKAAVQADAAVRLKPDAATPHFILGVVSLNMGRPERAVESLQRTLEISPDHVDANRFLKQALKLLAAKSAQKPPSTGNGSSP